MDSVALKAGLRARGGASVGPMASLAATLVAMVRWGWTPAVITRVGTRGLRRDS